MILLINYNFVTILLQFYQLIFKDFFRFIKNFIYII
jgi:hypothetical protein